MENRLTVTDISNSHSIWLITCKLRGVGELIKSMREDLCGENQETMFGIGTILVEIADELAAHKVRCGCQKFQHSK